MKKFLFLEFLLLFVFPIVTLAASNYHSSYIVLPANVQIEGSSRAYNYAKHKITINIDKIPSPSEPRQVVISINKKNLIGSTQKKRTTVSYYLGQNLSVEMGSQGKGNFWYGFGSFQNALKDGNSGHGIVYAGIESNNVVMTSYN